MFILKQGIPTHAHACRDTQYQELQVLYWRNMVCSYCFWNGL